MSIPTIMSTGLSRAKAENKNIFVYFTAPWCKWCKRMDDFVYNGKTGEVLGSAYVPVKIDVERTTGGEGLAAKYGWKADTGLPFFVLADANGKKLFDSVSKKGNVGFPAEPHEIAHFKEVIQKTAPGLTPEHITTLENAFKAQAP